MKNEKISLEDEFYNLILNNEFDSVIELSNEMKTGIINIYFFKNDNIYVIAKWYYLSLYILNIFKDGVSLLDV